LQSLLLNGSTVEWSGVVRGGGSRLIHGHVR
jgi:hypothetical protein